jgi:hypothetical protein
MPVEPLWIWGAYATILGLVWLVNLYLYYNIKHLLFLRKSTLLLTRIYLVLMLVFSSGTTVLLYLFLQ